MECKKDEHIGLRVKPHQKMWLKNKTRQENKERLNTGKEEIKASDVLRRILFSAGMPQ